MKKMLFLEGILLTRCVTLDTKKARIIEKKLDRNVVGLRMGYGEFDNSGLEGLRKSIG